MTENLMPLPALKQASTNVPPAVLLANHLNVLKLPTFVREHEKVALEAAQDRADHERYSKHWLARRAILKGGLAASALAVGFGSTVRAAAMTATGGAQIDPASVQLLFADLQGSLVADSRTVLPEALGRSAAVLAKIGTILKLATWFSIVPEGKNSPALIPELQPLSTRSNTIERTLTGPFMGAPTSAALAKSARKTLVVAGYAAELIVLQAVLDAIAAGYIVYYVVDAIGSKSAPTKTRRFARWSRRARCLGPCSPSRHAILPTFSIRPARRRSPRYRSFCAIKSGVRT